MGYTKAVSKLLGKTVDKAVHRPGTRVDSRGKTYVADSQGCLRRAHHKPDGRARRKAKRERAKRRRENDEI